MNQKFPFKKTYIKKTINELFINLKNYDDSLHTVDKFYLSNNKYFTHNIIDGKYKNKYRLFINDDSYTYDNINILSDYFSEKCRIKCKRHYTQYTPEDAFYNDIIRTRLIDNIIKRNQEVNNESLREELYKFYPECSNFRLTISLSIIKYFNGTRILDISAGWGDRLISALAYNKLEYYHGFDPSKCMEKYYDKIIKTLCDSPDDYYKYKIESIPFENAILVYKYNLIMTSPPYFDLEVYETNNNNQSIDSAKGSLKVWFYDYLLVWLQKAWDVLDYNGHMVINIEDKIDKNSANNKLYVEAMVAYVSGYFNNCKYQGVIGLTNKGNNNRISPLFVWKKTNKIVNVDLYRDIYEKIKIE